MPADLDELARIARFLERSEGLAATFPIRQAIAELREHRKAEPIPPKWLALAAELFERATDELSNHLCSDLDVPDGWTSDDIVALNRAIENWNSKGRDFDPETAHRMPPDWLAMRFLAARLVEMAKGGANG